MSDTLKEILLKLRITITVEEPRCTCKDDDKERPLCPICDKDEYKKKPGIVGMLKDKRKL